MGVGSFSPTTGSRVLAAYTQVKVFDTEWAFIAGSPTREAYAPFASWSLVVLLLGRPPCCC